MGVWGFGDLGEVSLGDEEKGSVGGGREGEGDLVEKAGFKDLRI